MDTSGVEDLVLLLTTAYSSGSELMDASTGAKMSGELPKELTITSRKSVAPLVLAHFADADSIQELISSGKLLCT